MQCYYLAIKCTEVTYKSVVCVCVCVYFFFFGGGGREGGRELIRVFTFPACNLQSVSWVLKNVVHNVPWFLRFYKVLKIGSLCKAFNLHNISARYVG